MGAVKKSETLTFRIDSETLNIIQRAARLQGRSVTSFVTQAARAVAEKEILDQRFFSVSAEAFDAIEAMLAEPAKVDEALVKLFRSERKWID
jgi:uncharacterized protein (DUF1778 family)